MTVGQEKAESLFWQTAQRDGKISSVVLPFSLLLPFDFPTNI